MKKTLSFVMALCLAVTMIASFALIVPGPASSSDPITLVSIKVTDAAGYAAPYLAVDTANAFVENQTTYVVYCLQVRSKDASDGILTMDPAAERTIKVTSSTLDLTYAPTTLKAWYVDDASDAIGPATITASKSYDATTNTFKLSGKPNELFLVQPGSEQDLVNKFYYAFIAITKPATTGEVKATLEVSAVKFTGDILRVYDSTGLKYIVHRLVTGTAGTPESIAYFDVREKPEDNYGGHGGHGGPNDNVNYQYYDTTGNHPGWKDISIANEPNIVQVDPDGSRGYGWYYRVVTAAVPASSAYHTEFAIHDADDKPLINFVNKAGDGAFDKIQAWAIPLGGSVKQWVDVRPDYFGKLIYVNAANVNVDVTDLVNSINTFFGFSFANTDYPVKASHFEAKTSGNPIIVTDTYNYVAAVVTESDDNIEIAPTGDFSANIVIVMAASAVLAAAALAFVAKKAHE